MGGERSVKRRKKEPLSKTCQEQSLAGGIAVPGQLYEDKIRPPRMKADSDYDGVGNRREQRAFTIKSRWGEIRWRDSYGGTDPLSGRKIIGGSTKAHIKN